MLKMLRPSNARVCQILGLNLTGGEDEELPSGSRDFSLALEHGLVSIRVLQSDRPPFRAALRRQDNPRSAAVILQGAFDTGIFAEIFIPGPESVGVVEGNDVPKNKVIFPEVIVLCNVTRLSL